MQWQSSLTQGTHTRQVSLTTRMAYQCFSTFCYSTTPSARGALSECNHGRGRTVEKETVRAPRDDSDAMVQLTGILVMRLERDANSTMRACTFSLTASDGANSCFSIKDAVLTCAPPSRELNCTSTALIVATSLNLLSLSQYYRDLCFPMGGCCT